MCGLFIFQAASCFKQSAGRQSANVHENEQTSVSHSCDSMQKRLNIHADPFGGSQTCAALTGFMFQTGAELDAPNLGDDLDLSRLKTENDENSHDSTPAVGADNEQDHSDNVVSSLHTPYCSTQFSLRFFLERTLLSDLEENGKLHSL